MSATCRQPCCSAMPRLIVTELFERGLRRLRETEVAIDGEACRDTEGNFARFGLRVSAGRIERVGFRCSSCATLIAYCELITEMMPNFSREIARGLTAPEIVQALPGVPALKHARAALAVAAFRVALDSYSKEQGEPYRE